ncbi:hypothetical protein RCL1_007740 [Eukaryota sp. TZLM3-RCL]
MSSSDSEQDDVVSIPSSNQPETNEPSEKPSKTKKTASEMNLVIAPRLATNNYLFQIEDQTFTTAGDVGCVGRLKCSEPDQLFLDIKGHLYSGTVIPSRTLMVVNVGGADAKIESLMSSYIECTYAGNIFDSEQIEGDVQFSFENGSVIRSNSDDENETEEKPKRGRKKAEASETKPKTTKKAAGTKAKASTTSAGKKRTTSATNEKKPTKKVSKKSNQSDDDFDFSD